jgi:hypothetical protein
MVRELGRDDALQPREHERPISIAQTRKRAHVIFPVGDRRRGTHGTRAFIERRERP